MSRRYIATHPAIAPLLRIERAARAALRTRLRCEAWEQADPIGSFLGRGGTIMHLPSAPDQARISAGSSYKRMT